MVLVEPRSRSIDNQAQFQAEYWKGPEAGRRLTHEHRYELPGRGGGAGCAGIDGRDKSP